MMKKIIFTPVFIFFFLTAFAQKPLTGDKQVTLGFQGTNSGYLMLKSYFKDDMARRYSFGGNGFNYTNSPTSTYNGSKITSHSFSVNSFLSYGIQKSFNGFEKIEPYIGIDYVLNFAISQSYYKRQVVDPSLTGGSSSYGDFYLNKYSGPSTIRLGLKPVAGFNYYIWKNFAVGIEYSINLFYIGYAIPGSQTIESQTNGIHTIRTDHFGSLFNTGTSFVNSVAVTVNYRFGNIKNKQASNVIENPEK